MATKQEASKQTEYEIESLPREENDNWSSEDRRAAMESRSSLGNEQGCCAIVRSKFCSRHCLRSKATILILVCNFIMVTGLGATLIPAFIQAYYVFILYLAMLL